MPKIETYTGSGGVVSRPRAAVADFVDVSGLQQVSKSFSDLATQLKEVRDTENKINAAKIIADGKQKWMLELDSRKQKVEAGEMDSSGMTEAFNSDYAKWADEISSSVADKNLSRELRINLTEMQNGMMGSVMDYEASRRAAKMTESYNAGINSFVVPLAKAKTQQEIDAAMIGADQFIKAQPEKLREKAISDLMASQIQNRLRVSKTPEDIEETQKIAESVADKFTPDEIQRFFNGVESKKGEIGVSAEQDLTKNLLAMEQMADRGIMDPAAIQYLNEPIRTLRYTDPAKADEYTRKIEIIADKQRTANMVWSMTDDEYAAELVNLEKRKAEAPNLADKSIIGSQAELLTELRNKRDQALVKDLAGVALQKSDSVILSYEQYKTARESNAAPEEQKNLFNQYLTSIDNFANKNGYVGPINYLPTDEAARLASSMKTALQKENGINDIVLKMNEAEFMYGDKYKDVMRQIRDIDPALGALTVISRIKNNTKDDVTTEFAKNEIVAAISAEYVDPNIYKDVKIGTTQAPYDTEYLDISQALQSGNMVNEAADRREAYLALSKRYTTKLNDPAKAQDAAYKIVYGDIEDYNGVVYPSRYKSDISRMMANSMAYMDAYKDIIAPAGALDMTAEDIRKEPSKYVRFVTSPNGDGLMPVWNMFNDKGFEPVKSGNGKNIIIKWEDAKNMRVPQKTIEQQVEKEKLKTLPIGRLYN